jgi:hypothetical protein
MHLHNGHVPSWTGCWFVGGDLECKCELTRDPLILPSWRGTVFSPPPLLQQAFSLAPGYY